MSDKEKDQLDADENLELNEDVADEKIDEKIDEKATDDEEINIEEIEEFDDFEIFADIEKNKDSEDEDSPESDDYDDSETIEEEDELSSTCDEEVLEEQKALDEFEEEIEDTEFEGVEELREEQIETQFETLGEMLDAKKYEEFARTISELNPVDVADFFLELSPKRIPGVFKLLKKDISASVFAELDSDVPEKIISAMTDREISFIIEELAVDDAVDMLDELPANMVARIMRNASVETRAEINRFLAYPDFSAGSVMTAEYVDLRANMTCSRAIEHIRRTGIDKETVYIAYVTDASRILQGTVSFKDLIFSDGDKLVGDIMETDIIYATTHDDKEYVADTISKYGLLALPIVDKENRLVGIVTVDDAIEVIQDAATEDIEMMAGITPSDKSYMKTGVWETWKKRFPWLLVLMISAIFSSAIITHYESAIGTYAILTAFFPMLMNTGGNAGSQSSVAIIRALSLDEIEKGDFFRVVWKEFRVSLICGIGLSVACYIKTILIDFRCQFTGENLIIAAIISVTAFFAVVVAKIIGTMLPMGAKKIGLDPAVMASPFITTIVDTITLVIYFGIASRVLGF